MPIVAAVEHHQDAAGIEATHHLLRIARLVRQAKPQHVHRRTDVADLDAGPLAHRRMSAVGTDHEIGADLLGGTIHRGAHADHPAALFDQLLGLGMHQEREARIVLAVRRQEVEEIPLRHHRDIATAHRQMGEVGDLHAPIAELAGEARDLVMRQFQELIEQAELVDHVQGRGMDGVAAEVAQEVAMLLQHHHLHAGARQQEPQHHAGRPAAHDAALGSHSSSSRSTRPVAVMASSAGTPKPGFTCSLVSGV